MLINVPAWKWKENFLTYLSNCSSKWVQKPRYTSLGEAVGKHCGYGYRVYTSHANYVHWICVAFTFFSQLFSFYLGFNVICFLFASFFITHRELPCSEFQYKPCILVLIVFSAPLWSLTVVKNCNSTIWYLYHLLADVSTYVCRNMHGYNYTRWMLNILYSVTQASLYLL